MNIRKAWQSLAGKQSGSTCVLCGGEASLFRPVDGVNYYECAACDFIFADPELLARIDAGLPVRDYDEEYWKAEFASARERSYGSSLARAAEAMLYCRLPITRFIDIGTGPGYLLDALSTYLPGSRSRFYGVEKFPPASEYQTRHENYLCSDLADVGQTFECGVCVEVIEHLTPAMAHGLADAMATASVPGSLFVFNTGLTSYVKNEDPGYLDPYRRGHITCWSVNAARNVFAPRGFNVHPLRGKTWAFVLERAGGKDENVTMDQRIWSPDPANRAMLDDPTMGSVMYLLGLESARAYG